MQTVTQGRESCRVLRRTAMGCDFRMHSLCHDLRPGLSSKILVWIVCCLGWLFTLLALFSAVRQCCSLALHQGAMLPSTGKMMQERCLHCDVAVKIRTRVCVCVCVVAVVVILCLFLVMRQCLCDRKVGTVTANSTFLLPSCFLREVTFFKGIYLSYTQTMNPSER